MNPTQTRPETCLTVNAVLASIARAKPAANKPLYVVEIGGGFLNFYRPAARKVDWPVGSTIASPETFRKILRDPSFRRLAAEGALHTVIGVTLFHAEEAERARLVREILGI